MTNQSETEDLKDLIVRKDGLTYKKYARVPFTGAVNRSDGSKTTDGAIFSDTFGLDIQMHYEKGARTVVEWFYDNGQIYQIIRYKNGEPHGLQEKFHENGQLKDRTNYKKGKAEGLSKVFHKDGHLESTGDFKNDELHGLQEWFYANGQLEERAWYKNGLIDGCEERYYKNGQLKQKGHYKIYKEWRDQSTRHGVFEYFFNNGPISVQMDLFNSRVLMCGQLSFRENYKDGNLHGLWESFNQDGQLEQRLNYKDGSIDD